MCRHGGWGRVCANIHQHAPAERLVGGGLIASAGQDDAWTMAKGA